MPEYKNIINNQVVISGQEKINELETQLELAEQKAEKLEIKLSEGSAELREVTSELHKFKDASGIAELERELARFKNTAQETAYQFKSFLNVNNLLTQDEIDYEQFGRWEAYINKIEEGYLSLNGTITEVKRNFGYLFEMSRDQSGGVLDATMVSDMCSMVRKLSDEVRDMANSIRELQTGSVGSGGGSTAETIKQIQTATHGMTEEARASYESLSKLFSVMQDFASLDESRLLGVSSTLRSISEIGKGSFGAKSLENIVTLIKEIQIINSRGLSSIKFDFSGMENLRVSKASLNNLATYLPQIAKVNTSKLKELSEINWSNLNNLQVKSASFKSVTEFAKSLEALIKAKAENIKIDEEATRKANATQAKRDDTQYYTKLTKAVNEYIASMKQLMQIGGVVAPTDLVNGEWTADPNGGDTNNEARIAQTNKLRAAVAELVKEEHENVDITKLINKLYDEYKLKTEDLERAQQRKTKAENDGNKILKQAQDAYNRGAKALKDWSQAEKSKHQSSRDAYNDIKLTNQVLYQAINAYDGSEDSAKRLKDAFDAAKDAMAKGQPVIRNNGDAVQALGDRFKKVTERLGMYVSATSIMMRSIRIIKQMVSSAIELESAFANLKIITNATDAEMAQFSNTAINLAKNLGQSVSDVTKSIEVFSRLGYSLEDASKLAEYATIMSNVAGVQNEEATTGLTAIIKGFSLDVDQAEHVADVLVEVGQKYAVSASEMMEAYEKSGAALNATNTSFEKSAGLIAAANAAVQNASVTGTALKTVSARIRGSKSDLEELGEDVEDLATGFSKYAKELQALTGFSILKEGTTDQFKDLYDIMDGIAARWDGLSDTVQARVAEILGGTRQLQVISSIINNWGDAAGAYETAMNSAGAATRANDIYMETAAAHIQQLKATFQELSATLVNTGLISQAADFASWILKSATSIAGLISKIG